jgi:putative effector of murein hydrolase
LTLSFVYLYGLATDSPFMDVLSTYKVGSLDPNKAGAGDILLHLLGPSVLSFATSMYSRKKLLQENLFVVLFAMLVSSVGGLFGTAFFANLINLGGSGGKLVRLSILPRNVTTALAIAISNILGGDISITASVVVLSGIVAATYSRTILDKLGITDPITRGLAVGSAGQGLGVASMIPEPDAFPFAAMAMVLTAVCSTTLVSFSSVKDVIIDIATSEKAAAAAAATATTV